MTFAIEAAPMICPEPSEFVKLIERVKDCDDSAMAEISARYGPAMRRTARELIGRSLRSHLDSVDLVQSVQLVLWLGLRAGKFSLDDPKNLLALVTTLLKRKVARYCRTSKPHICSTIEGNLDDTLVDAMINPMAGGADPTHPVELDDLVEKFLGQLSDLDRRMVSLRLEGYSTADVGRRLNVDASRLRVRLARLRKRFAAFRELLAQTPVRLPVDDPIV